MKAAGADEAGQSIVELALIMPVLLLLIATSFQMSLLFAAELALTNATRDGARWLAIYPDNLDATATTTIASRISSPLDPARANVTVAPSCTSLVNGRCASRPAGQQVSVTVAYDASSLWLFRGFYFPSATRTYTVYMRAEAR